MKIRLLKTVRGLEGRVYEKGVEVEARMASDGVPEVVGGCMMHLNPGEYEPAREEDERPVP